MFLTLAEDLKVDGRVVAPAGSRVVGEVVWPEKLNSYLAADLVVRMDYLNLGSRKLRLRRTAEKRVTGLFPYGPALLDGGLVVKAYVGEDAMPAPSKP